jgi:hypothetical protein
LPQPLVFEVIIQLGHTKQTGALLEFVDCRAIRRAIQAAQYQPLDACRRINLRPHRLTRGSNAAIHSPPNMAPVHTLECLHGRYFLAAELRLLFHFYALRVLGACAVRAIRSLQHDNDALAAVARHFDALPHHVRPVHTL